jgi:transposase
MNELCPMPGCGVERITPDGPGLLHIAAHGTRPGGRCPDCGRASRAVHSRYRRRPADLPSLGRAVRVGLHVRRFYCRNAACPRRTFAERLPELVAPYARRTRRLAEAQGRVGAALGGEASARLLPRLAMPASADTVLRLVRRMPLPEQPDPPRAVGVDDWAVRKGRTYGTILVDLERRRALDLLPDRTATTLADWLRCRPGIGVVARDRSTEYARGVLLGAPAAVQVADRWHLLANVRQALERWLAGAHARLRRLSPGPGTPAGARPGSRTGPFRRTRAEVAARDGRRARRVALHEEVRRRHAAGEKLLAIARATGLAVGTVRKYAYAESFPVPETRQLRPSILDPYLPRLEARLAEGCENGLALWRELRAAGFPGTARQVHRWLAERRTAPARTTPHAWRAGSPAAGPTTAGPGRPDALPSPARLAWLLVQPPAELSAADVAVVTRVEQDPEAASVAGLARRFTGLVRGCGAGGKLGPAAALAGLEAWLTDARTSGVRAVETFAAGLEQDGAAVRAALTMPWSNGQTEGQITRLKLLKRQMYGRASLDLLRRRMLLAA